MNVTKQNQSLLKSEIRHDFIRLTIWYNTQNKLISTSSVNSIRFLELCMMYCIILGHRQMSPSTWYKCGDYFAKQMNLARNIFTQTLCTQRLLPTGTTGIKIYWQNTILEKKGDEDLCGSKYGSSPENKLQMKK